MSSLCSALVLLASLSPQEQEVDVSAVDAFRSGEHVAALELWNEALCIPELGSSERSRLLYNAGNAAARDGGWMVAVAYYTEALEGAPRNADLWFNLEYARREAGLEPADRGDLAATCWRLLTAWTETEARWMVLVGALIFLVGLAYEALRGGRTGRVAAWTGLGIGLLLCAPLLRLVLEEEREEVIVVQDRGLALRSEPRSGAQVLEKAAPGTNLLLLDRLGDWVGVETSDGQKGWVLSEGVLALPASP
jgi:tetratricopeptide (TPR) repeat protein